MDDFSLKDDYRLANCCKPDQRDEITGFLKFDSTLISVHRADCGNLDKIEPVRLVKLTWGEIIRPEIKRLISSDPDYDRLDEIDFMILNHHKIMGRDYAAVVAKMTRIPRATVFDRHRKLRDLKLLVRVEPLMMQYRKGIAKNKWIKHRNHTYYELTTKGTDFIKYYLERAKS